MKEERIYQIHELLKERTRISLDELCEIFNVSKNTIRRDIAELEEQGIIRKVFKAKKQIFSTIFFVFV